MSGAEMILPAVNYWRTQAEASADINRQIVAKFGSDPDVLDEIRIQVMPCPDHDDGCMRTCIAAYPRKEGAAGPNLMMALYGGPPKPTLSARPIDG